MKKNHPASHEAAGPAASSSNPNGLQGHPEKSVRPELVEPQATEGQRPYCSCCGRLKEKCRASTGSARTDGGNVIAPNSTAPDPAVHDPAPFGHTPQRHRLDGWTPGRLREFIELLSESGNVAEACRRIGLSRQSAYTLRSRLPAFAHAWSGAILRHRDRLVDICMDRALNGTIEEVVIDGRLAERRRPDGATLRFMMARADRMAESRELHDRPARLSEGRLETLLDLIDPPGGGVPGLALASEEARAMIADIEDSALPEWDEKLRARLEEGRDGVREIDIVDALNQTIADMQGGSEADALGDPLAEPMGDPARDAPSDYGADPEPAADDATGEDLSAEDAAIVAALGPEDAERYRYLRWLRTLHDAPPEDGDTSDLDPADCANWTQRQWDRADRSGLIDRIDWDTLESGEDWGEEEEESGEEE